ncbi:MAG: bifunctional nuclease family protein [Chloroflexi bacterium]|nr:MAG: hypothetical protein CUN54_01970 [Phototrophicales bacterium]RMF81375.1 MAG: bifunctional nuclease family protein [Chloroflexota bacterium]
MIEVIIDSVRVSLMSQHRIVVLKDTMQDRYLPIWIGPFEADAITMELQEMPPQRPLTHDLLTTVIRELGGRIAHILVNELRNDVYYARVVIDVDGEQIEIDSRPSDAINLAVRAKAPIFVAESVMDKASVEPDEDVEQARSGKDDGNEIDEKKLSAFVDFVEGLDLEDLEDQDD